MKRALLSALAATLLVGIAIAWMARERLRDFAQGGDFTLSSVDGPFQLSSLKGKTAIIYFGFTQCPDICPLAFHTLKRIYPKLSQEQRLKLVPVFISVNYRGDTPELANQYVKQFFDRGVGLTGTQAQIDHVTTLFGTTYQVDDAPSSPLGYVVQHGNSFYLVNERGRVSAKVASDEADDVILKAIQDVI